MPSITNQACSDTYSDRATIRNVWNAKGGWFNVATEPVFFQLQYGPNGTDNWTDEQELGIGAFAVLPGDAVGVRFRNASAGQTASVTATIAQGDEPALAVSALGSVAAVNTPPTQTILSASGNYTPPDGCVGIRVQVIGGGGGGGGADLNPAGQTSAGGGGGGGGYAENFFPLSSLSGVIQVTIGAAGTGGLAGPNNGNAGGQTSFGSTGTSLTLMTAGGGLGGKGGTSTAIAVAADGAGGNGGAVGTGGKINLPGQAGSWGFSGAVSNQAHMGGGGLSAQYGIPPMDTMVVAGASNAGLGKGFGAGGGGGGSTASQGAVNGGDGAPGAVIITEFY